MASTKMLILLIIVTTLKKKKTLASYANAFAQLSVLRVPGITIRLCLPQLLTNTCQ